MTCARQRAPLKSVDAAIFSRSQYGVSRAVAEKKKVARKTVCEPPLLKYIKPLLKNI